MIRDLLLLLLLFSGGDSTFQFGSVPFFATFFVGWLSDPFRKNLGGLQLGDQLGHFENHLTHVFLENGNLRNSAGESVRSPSLSTYQNNLC